MDERIEKAGRNAREFAHKAWEQAKAAGSQGIRFVRDNREMIAMGIPVAIAAMKAGQSLAVNRRIKDERRRIDHTYYEPRTGFHWDLKRKLTNAERAEIQRRQQAGEMTYDILRQMKLIKR